ncbi:MAG: hypothetical protein ABI647_12975 [Gemmatimonadota bacterium]
MKLAFASHPDFAGESGLDAASRFDVHELRRATRVGPDGRHIPQVIVALTQEAKISASADGVPAHTFYGGSTLVVHLTVPAIKYRVVKNIKSMKRKVRTAAFVRQTAADPLRALFFAPGRRDPFAALHALADDGF